jgi:4,5-DOPA dioxygenase extradiol
MTHLSKALPTLFASHGSPMFALEPGSIGPALRAFGEQQLSTPVRAVLVMSPHWMAPEPTLMAHPMPATWHDFGGLPQGFVRTRLPRTGRT